MLHFSRFLPRDVMRRALSVRPYVRLSLSYILSNEMNKRIFMFFHHQMVATHSSFSTINVMAIFRRRPP